MMGCTKAKESVAPSVEGPKGAARRSEQDGADRHGGHGHHHIGFADPEKFAAKWDDPGRDRWQHPEEILAALALTPGATVADIGAGTGYLVAHLSKAVGERGTVIAIDVEPAMIAYMEKRREDLGPARVVPKKVGPGSPELQHEGVDGAVTLNTWHHIDGREAYARKVHAGLRRGGRFVVVESEVDAETGPPKEMRLEPDQVVKELEAGGFRVEVARESMPEHYMIVGYKD